MKTARKRHRTRPIGEQAETIEAPASDEQLSAVVARLDADPAIYQRPRCPRCGSVELQTNRSIDQGDGSRLRWATCRQCEHRLRYVLE